MLDRDLGKDSCGTYKILLRECRTVDRAALSRASQAAPCHSVPLLLSHLPLVGLTHPFPSVGPGLPLGAAGGFAPLSPGDLESGRELEQLPRRISKSAHVRDE